MSKCGQDIEISIRVLDENTKKYAEDFKCGNENIDYYFNKEAVDDTTSVTYLYIDNATDKLVACITLACSAIFTAEETEEQFSTILSAMEIKYLATNEEYQHMPYYSNKSRPSLSDLMFDYMISYMSEISHEVIGAAKIVLYAVPQAVSFYKRHGFKEFGDTMYGDEGYYVEGCKPMYLDLNV